MPKARQLTDWHGDTLTQAALTGFIDEGLLGTHIRKAGREYAARHREVTTRLAKPGSPRLIPSSAGPHVCALTVNDSLDMAAVIRRARARGVALSGLADAYAASAARPGILIGFGAIAPRHIAPVMDVLKGILGEHA